MHSVPRCGVGFGSSDSLSAPSGRPSHDGTARNRGIRFQRGHFFAPRLGTSTLSSESLALGMQVITNRLIAKLWEIRRDDQSISAEGFSPSSPPLSLLSVSCSFVILLPVSCRLCIAATSASLLLSRMGSLQGALKTCQRTS